MKTYKVNFNTNEVVVDKNKSASMFKYRALEKDYHKITDKNKSEFVFNARDFIDALEREVKIGIIKSSTKQSLTLTTIPVLWQPITLVKMPVKSRPF